MQSSQPYCQTISVAFAYDAHGTVAGVASEIRKEGSFWSGFSSGTVASFMSTTAGVLTQNLCEAYGSTVPCLLLAASTFIEV